MQQILLFKRQKSENLKQKTLQKVNQLSEQLIAAALMHI